MIVATDGTIVAAADGRKVVVASAFTVSVRADFQAIAAAGAMPVRILTAVVVGAAMAVLQTRLAVAVAVCIGGRIRADARTRRADFAAVAGYVFARVKRFASAVAVRDLTRRTPAVGRARGAADALFADAAAGIA